MLGKSVRRWRLVRCFTKYSKKYREQQAEAYIRFLEGQGFKARVHAPLPRHQTSGHTHIIALCNLKEKLKIGGVDSSF